MHSLCACSSLLATHLFSSEPLLLDKLHQVIYARLLRAAELLSMLTQVLHTDWPMVTLLGLLRGNKPSLGMLMVSVSFDVWAELRSTQHSKVMHT